MFGYSFLQHWWCLIGLDILILNGLNLMVGYPSTCEKVCIKKLMAHLVPYRHQSGKRQPCQRDCNHARASRWGDHERWTHTWAGEHQAAQQADPEGSEQKDSELQGGVCFKRSEHGRAQLLPGEQKGV